MLTANLLAQSCVADAYRLPEPTPCMKPAANTGCSTPKPAAVPTYMAMLSGWMPRSCATFAPISLSACSHEMRSNLLPTRLRGYFKRSGESYILCCLSPFTQP